MLNEVISGLTDIEKSPVEEIARRKMDLKTKPVGSLGMLEKLALRLSVIQNNLNPRIENKMIVVFAADHGVTAEGISAFPPEVTSQMVLNFISGGAAINVLCRHAGIDLHVVDMGVNYDFHRIDGLIDRKINKGTGNIVKEEAMTEEDALKSIEAGISVFQMLDKKKNYHLVAPGEMGIGNTTSATAIICAACRVKPEYVTGRGTGISDDVLLHKINVIDGALKLHRPDPENGIDILRKVGGYEIGGIAGYILAAAEAKKAIVLDGLISTSGAVIAALIDSRVKGYMIAGHRSVEAGHGGALKFLGLEPLLDIGLRLGEGTGAAMAMSVIEASAKIMCEMASFEDAHVTNKCR